MTRHDWLALAAFVALGLIAVYAVPSGGRPVDTNHAAARLDARPQAKSMGCTRHFC
jgi:hypothetical protein